jgi:hypothetical protein
MTRANTNPQKAQAYIAGRLSEPDLTAFEDQLLNDEDLVRELDESLRLREGFEILRERRDPVLQKPARRTWVSGVLRACAAAMIIIALYAGWHYVGRRPPLVAASIAALTASTDTRLTIVQSYAFAALRTATQIPVFPLPATGALELRALTSANVAGRTFRVTLERIQATKTSRIGAAEHLAPDADGFVVIYADASRLQPGDYSLIVQSDEDAKSPVQRFAFGLNPAPGTAPQGN